MKKAIIRDISFPDFKDISLFKTYGNNYFCITGETIVKPFKIVARCFFEKEYFPNTEEGYKQAQEWLMKQREFVMKKIYVEVEE